MGANVSTTFISCPVSPSKTSRIAKSILHLRCRSRMTKACDDASVPPIISRPR